MRLLLRAAERLGVEADAREVIVAYRSGSHDAWTEYLPRSFYLHRDLFREIFDSYVRGVEDGVASWRTLAVSATAGLLTSAIVTLGVIPPLFSLFVRGRVSPVAAPDRFPVQVTR